MRTSKNINQVNYADFAPSKISHDFWVDPDKIIVISTICTNPFFMAVENVSKSATKSEFYLLN